MAQLAEKNPNKDIWSLKFDHNSEDELVRANNGEFCSIWCLEWSSIEHAQEWYNDYAKTIGFSIRKAGGTYFNGTKEWKIRIWVCNKEGFRQEVDKDLQREKAHTRCGCKAIFSIERQPNGNWWTRNWNPRHDHYLITPSKVHLLKSQRKMNCVHQLQYGDADDAGIQPRQAHELMSIQSGGKKHLGFTHKDLKNYVQCRRIESNGVDALQAILNYFGGKENNSKYFFKMQLDESGMMESLFWSDQVMQNDYLVFGDFVSFDTTYRTNSENMPLGVFVGVNNHGEQIVFGACLLYSETTTSFEWVFETFLECMNRKSPQSLMTDQDASMFAAIPKVFKETKHYLCAWHINQNAMKHLGHLFGNEELKSSWSKLLWSSDILDFDSSWFKMIEHFNLQENEWLQRIYSRRYQWAPVFVRDSFCAGKRTTQMSESFNSRIRSYLKSNMNLGRFFKQFQRAVDFLKNTELESDFKMQNEFLNKKYTNPLSKHAEKVYTPNMLKVFHEEVLKSDWVSRVNLVEEPEVYVLHICNELHDCTSANHHTVTRGPQSYTCTCKNFSFIGIICCHIIWVLKHTGTGFVSYLPNEYILPRWTRNAKEQYASANTSKEDSLLDGAINYRKAINHFACSISKYVFDLQGWDVIQHSLATLDSSLGKLSIEAPIKLKKSANVSNVVSIGEQQVVVKGKKKVESKFRCNKTHSQKKKKRLKSCLEGRKKLNGQKKSSSQPINMGAINLEANGHEDLTRST